MGAGGVGKRGVSGRGRKDAGRAQQLVGVRVPGQQVHGPGIGVGGVNLGVRAALLVHKDVHPQLVELVDVQGRQLPQGRGGNDMRHGLGLWAGVLDHLVPLDDLDALAAVRLAGGALGGIQAVPALPGGHGDIAGGQEV